MMYDNWQAKMIGREGIDPPVATTPVDLIR